MLSGQAQKQILQLEPERVPGAPVAKPRAGITIRESQKELANVIMVAEGGTGTGNISVGGSSVANIDNSKHDQYNVGSGSSTEDRRMLQYAGTGY